jgi:hypothetical protein
VNRGTLYLLGLMTVMTAAYLLFLAASWNQYQKDREGREATINELLDKISRKSGPSVVVRPQSEE